MSTGVLLMVFVAMNMAHPSCLRASGASWTIETVDSAGDVGHDDTAIAVDDNGGIHISYFDYANKDLKYAYKAMGENWIIETADDSWSKAGFATSLAVDASGGVHISYYDGIHHTINYAYRPSSGGWSHYTIVKTGTYGSSDNAIAVDADHGVYILFFNDTNLQYAYKPSGGSWTISTGISGAGTTCQGLSLAIEESGGYRYLHVGYSVSIWWGTPNLKYATKRLPYGAWNIETVDWSGEVGYRNTIALDSEGSVHMSYRRGTYYSILRYAYKPKDGTWTNYTVDSQAQTGVYNSLALDPYDGVHISYYDGQNGDLKYAYKPKDGNWANYTIDATGSVGMYNSIAVDSNSHVHISYYDDTNHELKYATDITVPSQPLNVNATPGDKQVVLTWDAPASNGGSPITNYTIYRSNVSGGGSVLITLGSVFTYTDTAVVNDQTYYYKVSASNSMGEGLTSGAIAATPVKDKGGGIAGFELLAFMGAAAAALILARHRNIKR